MINYKSSQFSDYLLKVSESFCYVSLCQARKERQLHMQMYPGWSARDNYAQSKEVDFITSKVNITTNIITIF